MGILVIIGFIIWCIYKVTEERSWDNCKSNINSNKFFCDASKVSQRELKKRYKSGYYNKK